MIKIIKKIITKINSFLNRHMPLEAFALKDFSASIESSDYASRFIQEDVSPWY